jgi:AcrR family transcriptional regulator
MNHTLNTNDDNARPHETKDRILDVAEKLFAAQGFAATNLRQITAEAGVNLAAVNYHFQSKDALIQAVFNCKVAPLNRDRLAMLDEIEASAGDGPPELEDVLRAFLAPVMGRRQCKGSFGNFPQLFGRALTEPGDWAVRVFPQAFGEVKARFRRAFARSLPGADQLEIACALHMTIGSMVFFLCAGSLLPVISNGAASATDVEGALDRLVRFAAAGMRALARPGNEEAQ